MSDSVKRLIEERVLPPIVKACASEQVVIRGSDELQAMTRCFAELDGLDFAAGGNGRNGIYTMRESAQANHSLYFAAEREIGLRFTTDMLVGMEWREHDFSAWTVSTAAQLDRMWREALRNAKNVARSEVPLEAAAVRSEEIRKASERMRSFFFVNRNSTASRAVSGEQQTASVSSSDVLRCMMRHKVGGFSDQSITWSDHVARVAAATGVDRRFALEWLDRLLAQHGATAHPRRHRRDREGQLPDSGTLAVALVEAWSHQAQRKAS